MYPPIATGVNDTGGKFAAGVNDTGGNGGEDTRAGRSGGWGVNISEDERHRIALLQ